MKIIGNTLILVLALLCCSTWADVQAQVDRSVITADDILVLSLRATNGEDLEKADLQPLQADFQILNRSRNTSTTYRNGDWSTESELKLTLAPRRDGALTIPPLSVDGARTQQLSIGVNATRQDPDDRDRVFIEAEVDREQVYVQSQLIYTLRFYQSINLNDLQRSDFNVDNARIEELDNRRFKRVLNGITYLVTELRFAVFPEQSGTLQLPPMAISGTEANTRRSLFDRDRAVRRLSQEISVDVLPIPPSFPGNNWLASSEVNIGEDWSGDRYTLRIGESITRTITISAAGVPAAQIAPLEAPTIDGLKIYPDQPGTEEVKQEDGIRSISIQSAALLATRDGNFELPEISLPWWDVNTGTLKHAVLPARRISVSPPAVQSQAASANPTSALNAPQSTGSTVSTITPLWMWTTLAALLGWALTAAWLLRARSRQPLAHDDDSSALQNEKQLFKTLVETCRADNGPHAREALLSWGRCYFDREKSHRGLDLHELGLLLDSPSMQKQLDELEQALYSSTAHPWQGSSLSAELRSWREQHKQGRKGGNDTALPPLYGGA